MYKCELGKLCMVRRVGGHWAWASACYYTNPPSPPPSASFNPHPHLPVHPLKRATSTSSHLLYQMWLLQISHLSPVSGVSKLLVHPVQSSAEIVRKNIANGFPSLRQSLLTIANNFQCALQSDFQVFPEDCK